MAYKDLLVQVDQGPASDARVEAALSLADHFDAHLTALCLLAEPYLPASVGTSIPAEIVREQRERAEEEARRQLSRVDELAGRFGRPVERRFEIAPIDRMPPIFARHARHADLALVGQPDPERDAADQMLVVEAAFLHSGRPALIIPYIGARPLPPRVVSCCWDGSREAARAIHDALPLLLSAEKVFVVVVDAERLGNRVGPIAGADMAAHLAHHGLDVEVRELESGGLEVADVLLSHLADESVDLVVMGGYGHSRLREMVFGGVTRKMLAHMTAPVLMSH